MVRGEESGKRDLTYSTWHRTLPDYCYMVDADSIEWRNGKGIVAIIETCNGNATIYRKKFQMMILRELASKLGIAVYLVAYYTDDAGAITCFERYDLSEKDWPDCPKKVMLPDEYKAFIMNLGR